MDNRLTTLGWTVLFIVLMYSYAIGDLSKRVTKLEHMQDCVIAQGVNCQ